MIVEVLSSYFPNWKPPRHLTARGWNKVRCPNPEHLDSDPSCGLSLEKDRVRCFACGFEGDVYDIIQEQEGCRFSDAKSIAEQLAQDQHIELPPSPARKPGGRASGRARFGPGPDHEIPPGVRFRT